MSIIGNKFKSQLKVTKHRLRFNYNFVAAYAINEVKMH